MHTAIPSCVRESDSRNNVHGAERTALQAASTDLLQWIATLWRIHCIAGLPFMYPTTTMAISRDRLGPINLGVRHTACCVRYTRHYPDMIGQ